MKIQTSCRPGVIYIRPINQKKYMIKAVIFDMDGLMIDSEMLHFKAYQHVLAKVGIEFAQDGYWQVWGSDKEMCERLVKGYNLRIAPEELLKMKNNFFRTILIHNVIPKKGLFSLLEKLKSANYLLAVASGSQREEIEGILANLNISHYFSTVVSAESVERGKPAPDSFLFAAKKLGIAPDNCLVLEDSPRGVLAAKKAGMTCFAVPSQKPKKEDFAKADKTLKSLENVWLYLKK